MNEFDQLYQQILSSTKISECVNVLCDLNMDHNAPLHSLNKEALDLLAIIEAANMQHIPNQKPTWKSYGLYKVCKCVAQICGCPRLQRSSCIDNAYITLGMDTHVLGLVLTKGKATTGVTRPLGAGITAPQSVND